MAGSITISIEAGTVGLGTILPATSIEYYQGEQLSSVLLRLLQNTGFDWRNNGDATSGFYLKAIGRGGISANAAIPDDLMAHLQEVNCQLSDHDSNWLGEFDFTMDSGWLYSVNGEYMSVGMSSYFPADGDEVRLFRCRCRRRGKRRDMGGLVNEKKISNGNLNGSSDCWKCPL